ncbi:MAG: hypothetical protein WAL29_02385 [Bacteroidales bacterium]
MKRLKLIIGILLLLLLAGSSTLNAQRGMRGMMQDSVRMNRMRMDMRQDTAAMRPFMRGMSPMYHSPMWRGPMGSGMGHMWMNPYMRRGMVPGWWGPMGRGMDSTMRNRMRRDGMGINGNLPERIPNLTDNQKTAIEKIRADNQAEMKKFRDETSAKMKSMREKHRETIMDQLTPEQRKWVESNVPKQAGN